MKGINFIDDNHKMKVIQDICKNHKVVNLYLFGSYARGDYRESSDIDFLVLFDYPDLYHYFDNYLDFKSKLEEIFNKRVDLVEEQTIRNPILKESIDQFKILIYGQGDRKMVS